MCVWFNGIWARCHVGRLNTCQKIYKYITQIILNVIMKQVLKNSIS